MSTSGKPRVRSTPTPGALWQRAGRWRLLSLAGALILLLSACQTPSPSPAPQPEPEALEFDLELELQSLDLPVDEARRVRFLPPFARQLPTGEFASGLDLEIKVFNVDPASGTASGASLGRGLSTANHTVVSKRDTYATVWLAASASLERRATDYLRLEIRLAGATDAPACNGYSEVCLGYLDVYTFKGLFPDRRKVPTNFLPVPARLGVLPLAFKVLEAQPPVGGPPPESLSELIGLSGNSFDESIGNCVSSFLTRPGQGLQAVGAGLQAVGAVGGLFYGDAASLRDISVSPEDVAAELQVLLTPQGDAVNGAVFIVDDFRNGVDLPPELFSGNADLSGLAGSISHGALVLHHLIEMASAMMDDPLLGWELGTLGGQPYYATLVGGGWLHLQVVDVGAYDTDQIPGAIRAMLSAYQDNRSVRDVQDLVINMSFAIVPCTVLEDYQNATGLATFEDYLAALAGQNGVGEEYLGELDGLVSTPVDLANDPLLRFLECPAPAAGGRCDGADSPDPLDPSALFDDLYLVASSGNYGNPYPLYPAASEYVISVGSLEFDEEGYEAASYSNAAEIAAPGGLYQLSTAQGRTVAYAGTSFAAPTVSLYLAVDLMQDWAAQCRPGTYPSPGNWEPPELAHGTYDMTPFYSNSPTGPEDLNDFCGFRLP